MTLYTYYEKLGSPEKQQLERSLLNLWFYHHHRLGFNCVVLRKEDAAKHVFYFGFSHKVAEFPSANFPGFNVACFRRWLAMVAVGGGILMDYDCFIYDRTLFDSNPDSKELIIFQDEAERGLCPGIVSGSREAFDNQCKRFEAYHPQPDDAFDGTPDVSDMTILRRQPKSNFVIRNVVKDAFEPGWETAPAVHYKYAIMAANNCIPRSAWIPTLRKVAWPTS